jgi:YD repeat-containing protein
LTSDKDAAGGLQTLVRTGDGHVFNVTRTPATGNAVEYDVSRGQDGFEQLGTRNEYTVKNHACIDVGGTPFCTDLDDKVVATSDRDRDFYTASNPQGSFTNTLTDGMVAKYTLDADPRFGRSAGFTKTASLATPSGLTLNASGTRSLSLSNAADPFSLKTLLAKNTVNGLTSSSLYDGNAKTLTQTSPAGRKTVATLDAQGRVASQSVPGLYPANYTYDAHGRLASISSGGASDKRSTLFNYDSAGFLQSIVNAAGNTASFSRDAAGRITQQVLPDASSLKFSYDANGNLLSLTPPGKPAHRFAYTPINLSSSYTPPALGGAPVATSYAYDLDGKVTSITRPDGKTVNFAYDLMNVLQSITIARGTYE